MAKSLRDMVLDALSSMSGECRFCTLVEKIRDRLPSEGPVPHQGAGFPDDPPRNLRPSEIHDIHYLLWDLVVQRGVTPLRTDKETVFSYFLVHPEIIRKVRGLVQE